MNTESANELVQLGSVAAHVANLFGDRDVYPVLGAEGGHFLIEVSAGSLEERTILKNLYVTIADESKLPTMQDLASSSEIEIGLSDASYLVGLLSLLVTALGTHIRVLHPLDRDGNYLTNWARAVTAASERRS